MKSFMHTRWPGLRAGFIHVPGLPGQRSITAPGFAGLPLALQTQAVRAALEVAWHMQQDALLPGGKLD